MLDLFGWYEAFGRNVEEFGKYEVIEQEVKKMQKLKGEARKAGVRNLLDRARGDEGERPQFNVVGDNILERIDTAFHSSFGVWDKRGGSKNAATLMVGQKNLVTNDQKAHFARQQAYTAQTIQILRDSVNTCFQEERDHFREVEQAQQAREAEERGGAGNEEQERRLDWKPSARLMLLQQVPAKALVFLTFSDPMMPSMKWMPLLTVSVIHMLIARLSCVPTALEEVSSLLMISLYLEPTSRRCIHFDVSVRSRQTKHTGRYVHFHVSARGYV